MRKYEELKERLDRGDVIRLDGAVGTQLQATGVPMDPYCWAAIANVTHPYTVRKMHADYIKAGAEVITTNTYSAARHNYELVGLGDQFEELNLRAVALAEDARDRAGRGPVYIAGSVSNFGAWTEGQYQSFVERGDIGGRVSVLGLRTRSLITEEQARRNLREQAEILADAGVDFLLAEATGDPVQREWVIEAVSAVGIPWWAGFKCHVDEGDDTILSGYGSDTRLADELDDRLPLDADVVSVFHSCVEDTSASIPVVRSRWRGALGAYPEAGRRDYVKAFADPNVDNKHSVDDWVKVARDWVSEGVQVIGGCCGMGVDYIAALDGKLPDRISG